MDPGTSLGLGDQGAETWPNGKGRGGCDAVLVNFRLSPATAVLESEMFPWQDAPLPLHLSPILHPYYFAVCVRN